MILYNSKKRLNLQHDENKHSNVAKNFSSYSIIQYPITQAIKVYFYCFSSGSSVVEQLIMNISLTTNDMNGRFAIKITIKEILFLSILAPMMV